MSDENLTHVFYETEEELGHFYSSTADKAMGGMLIIFMVMGLFGNIAATFYFWGRRRENFPDYLYAVNSMVDTLISTLALPVIVSLLHDRDAMFFSDYSFCSAFALLFTFLQRYSMFVVMVISVTRTVAISVPFHTVREPLIKTILLVYGVLLSVTYITLFAMGKIFNIYFNSTVYCSPISYMVDWEWTLYMIIHLLTALVCPLTVFFSLIISCKSLMKKTVLGSEDDKLFWKISVTIALFTAVFLICNIPVFSLYVISSFKIWFNMDVDAAAFLPESFVYWYDWLLAGIFLTVLNASINPCLYFFRMPQFRMWTFKRSNRFGIGGDCRTVDASTSQHLSMHSHNQL